MQQAVPTGAILVKGASGVPSVSLKFDGEPVNFAVAPLFRSIGLLRGDDAGAEAWSILIPPAGFTEARPWDACHALLQQGFGVAGAPDPIFAEPDLRQQWLMGSKAELIRRLARDCDNLFGQNHDYPGAANPYWFRDDDHAQFDAWQRQMPEIANCNHAGFG